MKAQQSVQPLAQSASQCRGAIQCSPRFQRHPPTLNYSEFQDREIFRVDQKTEL